MADQPYQDLTHKVIGAAMKVHNSLGSGLKEIHYHRACSVALEDAAVSFEDELPIQVALDDTQVGLLYLSSEAL